MSALAVRTLVAGVVASAALIFDASAAADEPQPSPERMTRERYASYVKLFNARDERFIEYYDESIVFDHGPVYGVLKGRQAVLDFYRTFWTTIDEEIIPGRVAIDNEHRIMLVELSTRLRAREDDRTAFHGLTARYKTTK